MNDENIKHLLDMNARLLLVMGYATSVLLELGQHIPEEKKQGLYWVIESIENIVYLDKPLPPMP